MDRRWWVVMKHRDGRVNEVRMDAPMMGLMLDRNMADLSDHEDAIIAGEWRIKARVMD